MTNNFKELEREDEAKFKANTDKVKTSLDSNLGAIGFIADLIELYFSRLMGFFVSVSGGASPQSPDFGDKGRPKYPNKL